MRNFTGSIIAAAAMATGGWALPVLQLDIAGGSYDAGSETVVTSDKQFTLIALNSTLPFGRYYLSMALTPPAASGDYGSFVFNGATIDVTADMVYGTPPAESNLAHDPGDLAKHSIYPTWFLEYGFYFDWTKTTSGYNVEDEAGRGLVGSGDLFYKTFSLDMSGLNPGAGIHFDLYNESVRFGDVDVNAFAPFSHDAEYVPGAAAPEAVPEPGTLGLLGLGLMGAAFAARRRKA